MKKLWLLINLGITFTACCDYTTGQKDFASQLLQPGDVIEGYYTLHPYVQQTVAEWLKKRDPNAIQSRIWGPQKLSSLFTPHHVALDEEEIVMHIPRKTWSSHIIRLEELLDPLVIPFVIDIASAVLVAVAVDTAATSIVPSGNFSGPTLRITAAYCIKNLFKRIAVEAPSYPPSEITKIININNDTVVIKLSGLNNILKNVKKDLLPQGVWIKSKTGIPRILRKKNV